PHEVAVTPDGSRIYVTDRATPIVSVIDTATNRIVKTIAVGIGPGGIAITPDGRHVYVTNRMANTVSVINTAANDVIATIFIGSGNSPTGVAITPDGERIYVTNSGSASVSVIDRITNTIIDTVMVGRGASGIAITPLAIKEKPTAFDVFDIERARVKLNQRAARDRFRIRGNFVLSDTSDGIDVLNENIMVKFGTFSETIPAGSFIRDDDDDGFQFNGAKGGITQIKIRDDGEFRVRAKGLDLENIDLSKPISFSLQIGNDIGKTEILFNEDGRFRQEE
ncbi:YncE family protein, partial [Patescibacteria group bacterium]|nr:YncE family protein [Patescibacteria group bacterium]